MGTSVSRIQASEVRGEVWKGSRSEGSLPGIASWRYTVWHKLGSGVLKRIASKHLQAWKLGICNEGMKYTGEYRKLYPNFLSSRSKSGFEAELFPSRHLSLLLLFHGTCIASYSPLPASSFFSYETKFRNLCLFVSLSKFDARYNLIRAHVSRTRNTLRLRNA